MKGASDEAVAFNVFFTVLLKWLNFKLSPPWSTGHCSQKMCGSG